jgi:hypothetical protein
VIFTKYDENVLLITISVKLEDVCDCSDFDSHIGE